jgi:exopolysaccharide biosynthesis protein
LNTATELLYSTRRQIRQWSWFKKSLLTISLLTFAASVFLYLTPPGASIRTFLAETVITTRHRDWAWIFIGAEKRDYLVRKLQASYDIAAEEKQDMEMIDHSQRVVTPTRTNRTLDQLIKVEDISGTFWKGKKMYVFDPTTIKVMTPEKPGEGERISSMVKRTGAVAGVNGGGFIDPDGLGNGFGAIGPIVASGSLIFIDQDGSIPQHIVGFTKEGTLIIGKYTTDQLKEMEVTEAVSFYPRVIANGKPLITSGDGGWGRGPRTAVGQKADGTVIFIVVDGRQAHSVGATLKEIQDLFLAEDVINAGFLDGGASSELVVQGELLTKPSSRYGERRLPSAFLVYDHPEDAKANRVWDEVEKVNPGGAFDHPDFLKEQAELRAKQQSSPPPAKTTTPPPAATTPAKTESDTKKPETNTPSATTGSTHETDKRNEPAGNTPGNEGTNSGTPGNPTGNTQGGSTNGSTTSNAPGTANSTGSTPGTGNTTGNTSGNGTTAPGAGTSSAQGTTGEGTSSGATPAQGTTPGTNPVTPPSPGGSVTPGTNSSSTPGNTSGATPGNPNNSSIPNTTQPGTGSGTVQPSHPPAQTPNNSAPPPATSAGSGGTTTTNGNTSASPSTPPASPPAVQQPAAGTATPPATGGTTGAATNPTAGTGDVKATTTP